VPQHTIFMYLSNGQLFLYTYPTRVYGIENRTPRKIGLLNLKFINLLVDDVLLFILNNAPTPLAPKNKSGSDTLTRPAFVFSV